MARAIDSEAAYRFLSEQLVKETGAFSKGVNKGLNIARSALRNPDAIPALRPVSQEQVEKVWRGCKRCTATKDEAFDLYGACNFSVFGDAIYYWDSEYGWEGENILFCPWCGRPLTDEAVQMVMERLEALKDDC